MNSFRCLIGQQKVRNTGHLISAVNKIRTEQTAKRSTSPRNTTGFLSLMDCRLVLHWKLWRLLSPFGYKQIGLNCSEHLTTKKVPHFFLLNDKDNNYNGTMQLQLNTGPRTSPFLARHTQLQHHNCDFSSIVFLRSWKSELKPTLISSKANVPFTCGSKPTTFHALHIEQSDHIESGDSGFGTESQTAALWVDDSWAIGEWCFTDLEESYLAHSFSSVVSISWSGESQLIIALTN